jgi:hypothetical protein
MRTPQEIINELKHVTYWSQPNIKYTETMNLINELEATLYPVEEPVVEESIIEVSIDVVEQPIVESLTIETTIEEPIAEVVAPKKRTRKV